MTVTADYTFNLTKITIACFASGCLRGGFNAVALRRVLSLAGGLRSNNCVGGGFSKVRAIGRSGLGTVGRVRM